jgi:hypothetical protein
VYFHIIALNRAGEGGVTRDFVLGSLGACKCLWGACEGLKGAGRALRGFYENKKTNCIFIIIMGTFILLMGN